MLKQLKHWFVPHKHNDHRPHLIRVHGLAVVAMLIVAVQASAYALALTSAPSPLVHGNVLAYATGNITPVDLLTLTNQQRAAAGLAPLRLDARLNASAGLKAQDMFSNDYWNHESPACIQPWHWFAQAGYNYTFAGENLAKDFDTAAGVMDGWMNSPGHRANILNANYTDVGFAVENGLSPTETVPASGVTPYVTPPCAASPQQVNEQTTLVVAHYGATASHVVASAATPVPTPRPASQATPEVAALPAATPTPTPSPTATPVPTPRPTPVVAPQVKGKVAEAAPGVGRYDPLNPFAIVRTLSWNTLTTIGLLSLLLLVYLFTHLAVWRKGLKRWSTTHYRLYAAAQVSSLTIAIMLLAKTGAGIVG